MTFGTGALKFAHRMVYVNTHMPEQAVRMIKVVGVTSAAFGIAAESYAEHKRSVANPRHYVRF